MQKKQQFKLQLDAEISRRLSETADQYGLSANAIVAAAAYELSKVPSRNLWQALGRICAGETVEALPAPTRPNVTAGRAGKTPKRAQPLAIAG